MSRMRQVPVMDVTQREKAMSHTLPNANVRPAAQPFRPRSRKVPPSKLRLSDTPALLSSGCNSVREFCNNVQNITMDLNQLINSVENILPLLTAYITALQTRNQTAEPVTVDTPIEVSAPNRPEPEPVHSTQPAPQPARPNPSASVQAPPAPRPEDLQQLLENPLVKNLMANFMKTTAK